MIDGVKKTGEGETVAYGWLFINRQKRISSGERKCRRICFSLVGTCIEGEERKKKNKDAAL